MVSEVGHVLRQRVLSRPQRTALKRHSQTRRQVIGTKPQRQPTADACHKGDPHWQSALEHHRQDHRRQHHDPVLSGQRKPQTGQQPQRRVSTIRGDIPGQPRADHSQQQELSEGVGLELDGHQQQRRHQQGSCRKSCSQPQADPVPTKQRQHGNHHTRRSQCAHQTARPPTRSGHRGDQQRVSRCNRGHRAPGQTHGCQPPQGGVAANGHSEIQALPQRNECRREGEPEQHIAGMAGHSPNHTRSTARANKRREEGIEPSTFGV